jgi:sterol desaturase/sphingolipid hydroxylase (fatty acid hydroxylase superfamily)
VAEAFLTNLLGLIGYQIVGVAIFLPFEMLFPKAPLTAFQRSAGLIFLLATALTTAVAGTLLMLLRDAIGIQPLFIVHAPFGPFVAAIGLALWVDVQFYVLHRIEHRFLWRFHAVHHSVRNLSAANSYHHWTEAIWLSLSGIPLMFVDIDWGQTLGWLSLVFHYQQFYIHSASRPHFGPLRWLLVDNRYHRIHHSVHAEHHDKNFGAMTPLWDWMFGTMHMPKSSEWPDVGLAEVEEPQSLREWASLPSRYRERANLSASPSGGCGEALLDSHSPA